MVVQQVSLEPQTFPRNAARLARQVSAQIVHLSSQVVQVCFHCAHLVCAAQAPAMRAVLTLQEPQVF
jgi:hypothetical protein